MSKKATIEESIEFKIDLSIEESIYSLLYADYNRFIKGRLVFVKEIFLLCKEILPCIESKFNFFPSHFGPFSIPLAKEIDKMKNDEKIKVEYLINELGDPVYRFSLTNNGISEAKKVFESLPCGLKNKLILERKKWDSYGYTGIIRYVYSRYPEYTENSKIKDFV